MEKEIRAYVTRSVSEMALHTQVNYNYKGFLLYNIKKWQ